MTIAAQRKRALSNAPGAVRARRYRLRLKQGITIVSLPINERDLEMLERAGHLDVRLENVSPETAIVEAIGAFLGEFGPSKK